MTINWWYKPSKNGSFLALTVPYYIDISIPTIPPHHPTSQATGGLANEAFFKICCLHGGIEAQRSLLGGSWVSSIGTIPSPPRQKTTT